MDNKFIGIAGVIALTLFLLALRHSLFLLGRLKQNRSSRASQPGAKGPLSNERHAIEAYRQRIRQYYAAFSRRFRSGSKQGSSEAGRT